MPKRRPRPSVIAAKKGPSAPANERPLMAIDNVEMLTPRPRPRTGRKG